MEGGGGAVTVAGFAGAIADAGVPGEGGTPGAVAEGAVAGAPGVGGWLPIGMEWPGGIPPIPGRAGGVGKSVTLTSVTSKMRSDFAGIPG